jgi:hypothetical protein
MVPFGKAPASTTVQNRLCKRLSIYYEPRLLVLGFISTIGIGLFEKMIFFFTTPMIIHGIGSPELPIVRAICVSDSSPSSCVSRVSGPAERSIDDSSGIPSISIPSSSPRRCGMGGCVLRARGTDTDAGIDVAFKEKEEEEDVEGTGARCRTAKGLFIFCTFPSRRW